MSWRVMHDLVVPAELGVLVLQRVEGVRVAGHDPADRRTPSSVATSVARELLEQHLVAGAAHAFAGRGLARAEDRELHARRA